jgi:hypothetical protein
MAKAVPIHTLGAPGFFFAAAFFRCFVSPAQVRPHVLRTAGAFWVTGFSGGSSFLQEPRA